MWWEWSLCCDPLRFSPRMLVWFLLLLLRSRASLRWGSVLLPSNSFFSLTGLFNFYLIFQYYPVPHNTKDRFASSHRIFIFFLQSSRISYFFYKKIFNFTHTSREIWTKIKLVPFLPVRGTSENVKKKSQQHPKGFPGGPPPQYWPGLVPINCRVRMGSGVFDTVWPLAKNIYLYRHLPDPHPTQTQGECGVLSQYTTFTFSRCGVLSHRTPKR